jgi:hypothetical protein
LLRRFVGHLELLTKAPNVEHLSFRWAEAHWGRRSASGAVHVALISRRHVLSILKSQWLALQGNAFVTRDAVFVSLCPSKVILHIRFQELTSLGFISEVRYQLVRVSSSVACVIRSVEVYAVLIITVALLEA